MNGEAQARGLEEVPACPACEAASRSLEVRVRAQMETADEDFQFVRCGGCGLVYLDPRVPAERLHAYYPDWYLPHRGGLAWGVFGPLVEVSRRKADRERVRLVESFASLGTESVALDVGCGRPTFLRRLVEVTGCRGMGLDFVDTGWRDEPGRWEGLDLILGELGGKEADAPGSLLPLRPDVVTMWHFLEHDYHPLRTLRATRAALLGPRGGTGDGAEAGSGPGWLFIEVPDHDSWTREVHGPHWAGYHAPRHAALYNPDSLSSLLERTGFEVVDIRRRGSLDPYALHWMSLMEREGIDWSGSMAPRFPGFLLGKLAWMARFGDRADGLGVLTAVAKVDR